MHTRLRSIPASLLMLGLALAAPASASDVKTLILRGRIADADGSPLSKARVFVEGTHRASVPVDEAGQFEITLPLGSASDLARRMVAMSVHAEQRGWRTELPGGDAELGIELRPLHDEDGVAWCEVRSNDAGVNAAIAQALAARGKAAGIATVTFIATRGERIGLSPAVDLPVVGRVALSAAAGTARAPQSPLVAAEPPAKKGSADQEKAKKKGAEQVKPTTPAPVVVAPSPKDAERELAEARRRAEKERSLAREAAKRSREEAQNRDRLQRRTLAEEKARSADEQRSRGSAEDELLRGRKTIAAPPQVADRDTLNARPPQKLPGPPAVAAPAPAQPPAPAPARPPAPVPARAPALTREPAPTPAPTRTPALTENRDPKIKAPRLTAPRDTGRVRPPPVPRPDSGPRGRARPLVIRAPAPSATAPRTLVPGGDSCSCQVEGTVEVDSDRPLPDRERIAVSLVVSPSIGDTVELFMGSPRSFKLPPVPCGPQRLRLISLGAIRYDVISRETVAGFRCERGARYPFRVILKPR